MKLLKQILVLLTFGIFFWACGSTSLIKKNGDKEEPVVIANDSLAYEITIIDIGFTAFLNSIAQPEGFYSQNYLETRNRVWVTTWNMRALNLGQYSPIIYENIIDYQQNVDYGYEVNYKLFNYFLFAQNKYEMNLGGGFQRNRIN
ncbi:MULTISPECIES: DUF6146 family protein [unclassified Polaribacter]|uniref:DUF6146 family protein n=1 Tax=unclassified Polaribacter TaxID=196858 RepID=UPI0011BF5949|nr:MULTISPECIES: DUF6146 family protein [unclassified Polaribacter]TXD50937.1 hypothetical protein ES043_14200 [Polaribacter sp. IC063]TXD62270.1 hypothetical protein ES044_01870 [Polaribacter sp. IC066]